MQISLDACGVPLLSRQITRGISSKVAATGSVDNSCEKTTGCHAERSEVICKVLHATGVLAHHDFGGAELGNYSVRQAKRSTNMNNDMMDKMMNKVRSGKGFIAALDQSGGSTPKALKLYGVLESEYSGDEQMFDLIHAMRSRIIKSSAFSGERVLGAILFEMTMDRTIDGKGAAEFLWENKGVVPFLKIDKGLADDQDGVQVMKPMPELDALLAKAKKHGVFGTKMRSVIKLANEKGINDVVRQQFEVGKQIIAAGLVPIIEPEVDINSPQKAEAEVLLKAAILSELNKLSADQNVMLKLTLPNHDGFFAELVKHPRVVRVVALSGGYSREDANKQLAKNAGVIASFSRALTEGLSAKQSDAEFDALLNTAIQGIYDASNT